MPEKNNLNLSTAIIFSAIIIAGGIFFGLKTSNPSSENKSNSTLEEVEVRLPDNTDYLLGSPDADITLIEYSDLECPACKFFHPSIQFVVDKYAKDGKFAWIYRQFPLTSLHSQAVKESEAVLCAGKLGGNTAYWDLVNKIFEVTPSNNKLDLTKLPDYAVEIGLDRENFTACLESGEMTSRVEQEYNEAVTVGAKGTPFSLLVLKNPLSDKKINEFKNFILLQGLRDKSGKPLIEVKNQGKIIVLDFALRPEGLDNIIQQILKLK